PIAHPGTPTLSLHDALPICWGSTGESSPVDGNSTATIALSTLLAASSATLGTLGIAATLLAALSSGFGGALGIVSEIAFATTMLDRKSTRLNSSHVKISYAV